MTSVILVNWNSWADTIACIQSLLNSKPTTAPVTVIVVDNMSTDDSRRAFEHWADRQLELTNIGDQIESTSAAGAAISRHVLFGHYDDRMKIFSGFADRREQLTALEAVVYFIHSEKNGGFGYGCNVGMRLADRLGADVYWLLNNDCAVAPDALEQVRSAVLRQPNSIFGTIVRYYHRPDIIQAFGGGYLSRLTGRCILVSEEPLTKSLDFIYGASMAFSRGFRSRVGDFDESIFMYFEENDLCLRAAAAGFSCDVVKVDVFHKHGGSQGKVPSAQAWMNVLVNKNYVLRKHYGRGIWTLIFYASLMARCILPFGGSNASLGARMALKKLIGKGSIR